MLNYQRVKHWWNFMEPIGFLTQWTQWVRTMVIPRDFWEHPATLAKSVLVLPGAWRHYHWYSRLNNMWDSNAINDPQWLTRNGWDWSLIAVYHISQVIHVVLACCLSRLVDPGLHSQLAQPCPSVAPVLVHGANQPAALVKLVLQPATVKHFCLVRRLKAARNIKY